IITIVGKKVVGKKVAFTILDALGGEPGGKPWCSIQVEVREEDSSSPKSRGSITVVGGPEFLSQYQAALTLLRRSPSAHKMITDAVPSTGEPLDIKESPGEYTTTDPRSSEAGRLNPDGTPGPGSNVTIRFNSGPIGFRAPGGSEEIVVAMKL